jgi:phage/plasmid-associated DNA primase
MGPMPNANNGMSSRKRTASRVDEEENDQRKRERETRVVARFENMTKDDTEHAFEVVCRKWSLVRTGATFQDIVDNAFQNFGFDITDTFVQEDRNGTHGLSLLDERIHDSEMEVLAIYHKMREHEMLHDQLTHDRIQSVLGQVYYSKRLVLSTYQGLRGVVNAQHRQDGTENPVEMSDKQLDQSLGAWSLRFRWIDDDIVPYQRLLLFMLDKAVDRNFRRQGDMCFEPIVVNGHNTHAWRAVCTIKEWIYRETSKETNYDQWHWLTANANNPKTLEHHLTNCIDYSFPVLKKDRSTFAFTNGVYRARENTFHPYTDNTLSPDIAACKFFDQDFPVDDHQLDDPRDIPTRAFQSIMDYQGWGEDVQTWMYIMLGRVLYNLNELDGWQVIPFMAGVANCGKSTITLKIAKQFYMDVDTGTLSNNIETKFGLSQFYNKLLFVAPEIKSDLRIEQAEFQSIVSGEDITINVKNRTAFSTQWKVPGILAGNEVPSWADNSGSIQRRIVLFDFPKAVVNGDMKLADKLQDEMPSIMLKCNRLYLDAVEKWSSENIWTVLPSYFLGTRNDLAATTNVLEAFVTSDMVALDKNGYMSLEDFKMSLRTFATANNYAVKRFTKEFFRGVFDKYGITKVREERMYNGRLVTREYLDGVSAQHTQSGNNTMLG